MNLIIRGGTLVLEEKTQVADMLVRSGKIARIGKGLRAPRAETVDARGQYVFPGAIDPHTHHELDLGPGRRSVDIFVSGSWVALMSGVTTMFDFAHQEKPGETLLRAFDRHQRTLRRQRLYNRILFHSGVMRLADDLEAQIAAVAKRGVRSFKLCLNSPAMTSEFLWRAFAAIARVDGIALLHCEDGQIVEYLKRTLHAAGKRAARFIPASRPASLETAALAQALTLARAHGTRLYIVHLSTGEGAQLIALAQQAGLPIVAETCPQYLLLDESIYRGRNGHLPTCTPPMRTKGDNAELWHALQHETISCLATDHCPFTRAQKNRFKASFVDYVYGLPGLGTAVPLLLSEMTRRKFPLPLMGRLLATNAARTFGLYPHLGVIRPGAAADLFLYDPRRPYRLPAQAGNCDWSPFAGRRVSGAVTTTIMDGQVAFLRGND